MAKTSQKMVVAFIDPELKQEVKQVLNRLGIPMSAAVRMLFQQIAMREGLPFDVTIPEDERGRPRR